MKYFDRQRAHRRPPGAAPAACPSSERAAPLSRSGADALRLPPALRADCAHCAGLCCVVPTFYAAQGFGFDKPAHTACRHLKPDHRCAIHADLEAHGFSGCRAFDCYGAGQRATQQLRPAISWRTSPEAAASVFAAYERLLVLHRLMALLAVAEAALPAPFGTRLAERRAQLDALCSAASPPERLDTARVARETMAMIRRNCRLAGVTPGDAVAANQSRR